VWVFPGSTIARQSWVSLFLSSASPSKNRDNLRASFPACTVTVIFFMDEFQRTPFHGVSLTSLNLETTARICLIVIVLGPVDIAPTNAVIPIGPHLGHED
jgi:hypothetical protein